MALIINDASASEEDVNKINEIYDEAIRRAGATGGKITLIDSQVPEMKHYTTNYSGFNGLSCEISHGFRSPVETYGGYNNGSLLDPNEREITIDIITKKIRERIRQNA